MMRYAWFRLVSVAIGLTWVASQDSVAQTQVIGPGSTVEGDVLRGEGVYLQGLSWFELNNAKAMAINLDNEKKLYDWNVQIAQAYRREYNASVERNLARRRFKDGERARFLAENELTLRTKPTHEDIRNGTALNALLMDLSNPGISESSWRGAKIPLPEGVSIKALAFQFVPKPGARGSQELSQSLIALGRLDMEGRWPPYLASEELKSEREAYEAAYVTIREQSAASKLEYKYVEKLDIEIEKLITKAAVDVPVGRNFRAFASKYVQELKAAARMFNAESIGFAQEMISDTSKHEAHTVGELLSFMRKYRLIFATADNAAGGEEIYARIYRLMREQKELLGIKSETNTTISPTRRSNELPVSRTSQIMGGLWKFEGQDLVQLDKDGRNNLFIGEPDWSNYTLKCQAMSVGIDDHPEGFVFLFHVQDMKNYGRILFGGFGNKFAEAACNFDNKWQVPSRSIKKHVLMKNHWYDVVLEVRGKEVKCLLDGEEFLKVRDEHFIMGRLGIQTINSVARFRNIEVRSPEGRLLWKGDPDSAK